MSVSMNPADPAALVRELRALAADAKGLPANDAPSASGAPDFASLLARAVDRVNELQGGASSLSAAFERGDPNVSVAQVMVATQKAGIAFQALAEVRNRLVRAYQDVMGMPI